MKRISNETYYVFDEIDDIYFVDFSDPILRFEYEDFDKERNIQICDLSWDLEYGNIK